MTSKAKGRQNDLSGPEFPDDFVDFVHELNAYAVEYVLVGGYAMGVHGHVRATTDIDFFYRPTTENVARLVGALQSFGAPAFVIDPVHLATAGNMAAFGAPPTRIDMLASIDGVSFDEAAVGALHVDVDGETLPVIGLDALRANKKASGRPKDLDDVKRLSAPKRHRTAKKKPKP